MDKIQDTLVAARRADRFQRSWLRQPSVLLHLPQNILVIYTFCLYGVLAANQAVRPFHPLGLRLVDQ